MEEKIRLANGAEYECSFFGLASVGILMIQVNMSFVEAATVFGNKDALTTITHIYGGDGPTHTLKNFTKLAYIVDDGDCIRVALQQPIEFEEVGNA